MKIIQRYINLYLHKINTQNALWQRYTRRLLFLGFDRKCIHVLLAKTTAKFGVEYGY